jgi:type II secretory pathway component PulL
MTTKFASLTGLLLAGKGKAQPMTSAAWDPTRDAASHAGLRVVPTRVSSKNRSLRIENAVLQADALHAKSNRLTVRFHPARYLRIKLAAGHMGCTVQELARTALELYLDRMAAQIKDGACACLNAVREEDDARIPVEDGRDDADPAA